MGSKADVTPSPVGEVAQNTTNLTVEHQAIAAADMLSSIHSNGAISEFGSLAMLNCVLDLFPSQLRNSSKSSSQTGGQNSRPRRSGE